MLRVTALIHQGVGVKINDDFHTTMSSICFDINVLICLLKYSNDIHYSGVQIQMSRFLKRNEVNPTPAVNRH